ncbi:hypothetical protein OUY22_27190 [Nonomuraea sp. MCN248]|uniref:Uncharacterized protein n=1 Tax=Nonomuraea corallina TaxID=2989783 RepID=A0ABT4SJ19_9ACTN|nr:hypothetical protein [Nonomuraea corallina]MDA0637105.1 hypothetical protein [Nonomuraea corallina]
MQDPTEPDRLEILNGPGDHRRAASNRPSGKKKITVIAAAVLVAALGVGGVGYALTAGAADPGAPAQQSGQAGPGQGAGEDTDQDTGQGADEPLRDDAADEATMGDADTELPEEEAAEMGDAAVGDTSGDDSGDTSGDTGNSRDTGQDASKKKTATEDSGAKEEGGGKKPTTAAKPPQSDGDDPADGPAGAVTGQCAKSGC